MAEGCRYFGYEGKSDKGKYQPADVQSGKANAVASKGGSQPAIKLAKGGANATPAGVHKHSGTENHVKVQHKNARLSGPAKKSGADATPEGVRKFSGKSVKKQ